MNSKIIGGFLAGIIVAGGGVFLLMRDDAVPTVAPAPVATSVPAPVAAPPVEAVAPMAEAPAPEPVKQASSFKPAPAKEKRPMAFSKSSPAPVTAAPIVEVRPSTPAPVTTTPPAEPAPVATATLKAPAPVEALKPPEPRKPMSVTLTAGTLIPVRINEQVSSETNITGDLVMAVLSEPLVVNGFVIAERGARAEGRLVEVTRAGKVKGVAHLAVELTSFYSSDGQKVTVHTATFEKDGDESKKGDAAKVGAAAGIGAIIGAIAGGGKGAAIGAGAGGAAGAGGVLLTRGKPAVLPVETLVSFRLTEPVTITERLK